jgi:hypothetical protein
MNSVHHMQNKENKHKFIFRRKSKLGIKHKQICKITKSQIRQQYMKMIFPFNLIEIKEHNTQIKAKQTMGIVASKILLNL